MGILDNFNKLKKYTEWKNREKTLNKEITDNIVKDTTFIEDYSAFKRELIEKLNTLLIDYGYRQVTMKPHRFKAKYFEAFRLDSTVQNQYKVHVTKGGEYIFSIVYFELD